MQESKTNNNNFYIKVQSVACYSLQRFSVKD